MENSNLLTPNCIKGLLFFLFSSFWDTFDRSETYSATTSEELPHLFSCQSAAGGTEAERQQLVGWSLHTTHTLQRGGLWLKLKLALKNCWPPDIQEM